MKWTTTKLIGIAGLAAVYLALALGSSIIPAVTGVVGSAGVLMIFLGSAMVALCCLLIKKFGAATLLGLIYGFGSLPLGVLGPLGFLPKIFIGLSLGIIADIIFLTLKKRERIAAITIGAITQPIISWQILIFSLWLAIPGTELIKKMLAWPLQVSLGFAVGGGIGGWIGYLVYKKLKNTSVVRRIQGD